MFPNAEQYFPNKFKPVPKQILAATTLRIQMN